MRYEIHLDSDQRDVYKNYLYPNNKERFGIGQYPQRDIHVVYCIPNIKPMCLTLHNMGSHPIVYSVYSTGGSRDTHEVRTPHLKTKFLTPPLYI